jgi:hypothetical protein
VETGATPRVQYIVGKVWVVDRRNRVSRYADLLTDMTLSSTNFAAWGYIIYTNDDVVTATWYNDRRRWFVDGGEAF